MQKAFMKLALCAVATLASSSAVAQTPEVTLTRLDCGTPVENDISGRFTDTLRIRGKSGGSPTVVT